MTALQARHMVPWVWVAAVACQNEHLPAHSRASARASVRGSISTPAGVYHLVQADQTQSLGALPMRLLRGFGVTVVDREASAGGEMALTRSGLRLPARDLRRANPSRFAGVVLRQGDLAYAWVRSERAGVWKTADAFATPIGWEPRLARVRLTRLDGPEGYYRTARGWMRAAGLSVPTRASRPAGVLRDERWIDVDLAAQTLVAYEGDQPVYATLVSAGVGRPGSAFATPLGEHRITAKLRNARMSNLQHTGVVPYFYEEVPYTQYIGRVALHGVYWHDRFGEPQSHGCINVSLADAAWLYAFTDPRSNGAGLGLKAGYRRASAIRVR